MHAQLDAVTVQLDAVAVYSGSKVFPSFVQLLKADDSEAAEKQVCFLTTSKEWQRVACLLFGAASLQADGARLAKVHPYLIIKLLIASQAALESELQALNDHLSRNGPYLKGAKISAGDLALA